MYWSSANNFSSGISTKGDGHSNQISSMVAKNGKVYSVGMDDMMRHIQLSEEPNYEYNFFILVNLFHCAGLQKIYVLLRANTQLLRL